MGPGWLTTAALSSHAYQAFGRNCASYVVQPDGTGANSSEHHCTAAMTLAEQQ